MGIVVIGAVFVDIKGFPEDIYVPEGRNAGRIEYIHGGVTRNVVEDIANVELRPTYVSIVDTSALGEDVVRKLKRHKVDTSYVKSVPGGMGTWLAVFDNKGDLAGSISQRPNLYPILYTLEEKGDEIISKADSIVPCQRVFRYHLPQNVHLMHSCRLQQHGRFLQQHAA